MVKWPSVFHPVATTLMIAAIVVLAGLPYSGYAQNRPAPQVENFELTFQQGDPSFVGFDVPLQSPNLFQVIRQSGIDVDQMLATAGYSVDWLLTRTGKTTDFILDRSQVSAQFLLNASKLISQDPVAVQLRFMQTLTEITGPNNTTTIVPIPVDLISHLIKVIPSNKSDSEKD